MENHNGIIVVSSRQIAEDFRKKHCDVLEKINSLIPQIHSTENSVQYFVPSEYKDGSGKTNPAYDLTRDGFSLLVMGFTGSAALQWKLKYIDTFNKMETVVKQVATGLMPSPDEAKRIRADAMMLNAKTRAFKTVKSIGNDKQLSAVAYQLYGLSAIENLLGEKVGYSPECGKLFTATEIANSIGNGCNKSRVGKMAKAHDMQTDPSEYGIWALDKSKYSAKQINSFRYNEKGKAELMRLFSERAE